MTDDGFRPSDRGRRTTDDQAPAMTIEELDVFKLAHELTIAIYRISKRFPADERFGLVSQMRRAASSVPSNLMEGSHRVGSKELKHFVSIARGSCGELKYQIVLSRDLGYIEQAEFDRLRDGFERVSMMLTKLYASLDGRGEQ
jgi:four helix bundle protein